MTAIYRKRDNLFTAGETEWRADDDALVRRTAEGAETRFPWSDVMAVRLRFNPTMAKRWLHESTIATKRERLVIDNSHFVSVSDFEDRSATYSPFMRAALERIAASAPDARVEIGTAPLSFWLLMLFMVAGMGALVAVLIYLPLPAPFPVVAIAKLAIIVYLLTLFPRWLRGAWPRHGDLKRAAEELP